MQAQPDRPYYFANQQAAVAVSAQYLLGKPVPRGHARIVREANRGWNYKEQKWDVEEADVQEGELDDTGRFTATFDMAGFNETVGQTVNGTTAWGSGQLSLPVAVAVDASHSAWVANQSGSTVTRISPDGSKVMPISCCNGASGLAGQGMTLRGARSERARSFPAQPFRTAVR